jgi:hypothetical protein
MSPVEWEFYLCSIRGSSAQASLRAIPFCSTRTTSCACIAFPFFLSSLSCHVGRRTDGIQSLLYALCNLYARCTRTVSVPAPISCQHQASLSHCIAYLMIPQDAHNMCTRAKNHYDPWAGQELFTVASDVVSTAPSQAASGAGNEGSWVTVFQRTLERINSRILNPITFGQTLHNHRLARSQSNLCRIHVL